jgi:hypothetical protein
MNTKPVAIPEIPDTSPAMLTIDDVYTSLPCPERSAAAYCPTGHRIV